MIENIENKLTDKELVDFKRKVLMEWCFKLSKEELEQIIDYKSEFDDDTIKSVEDMLNDWEDNFSKKVEFMKKTPIEDILRLVK